MAKNSVEPISLVERGSRLSSVNEVDREEEGLEMFVGFQRGRHGCGYKLVFQTCPYWMLIRLC